MKNVMLIILAMPVVDLVVDVLAICAVAKVATHPVETVGVR